MNYVWKDTRHSVIENGLGEDDGNHNAMFCAQAEALIHQKDDCNGFLSELPKLDYIKCPICLKEYAIDNLSFEHIPQKSFEDSRFSQIKTFCYTCLKCNNENPAESDITTLRSDLSLRCETLNDPPSLCNHKILDIKHQNKANSLVISDLKNAFLLSFLALGYSYIELKELKPIREVFEKDKQKELRADNSGLEDYPFEAFHANIENVEEFTVLEYVSKHMPNTKLVLNNNDSCVFVVGKKDDNGYFEVISLPTVFNPSAKVSNNLSTCKKYEIPNLRGSFNAVEEYWDTGKMFHIDRCISCRDHYSTIGYRRFNSLRKANLNSITK